MWEPSFKADKENYNKFVLKLNSKYYFPIKADRDQ